MGQVPSAYLIEEGGEAAAEAELVNGARQDVLNVGKRIGDFNQIVLRDRLLELVELLLDQGDAQGAALRVRDRRLLEHGRLEQAVERGHIAQGARLAELALLGGARLERGLGGGGELSHAGKFGAKKKFYLYSSFTQLFSLCVRSV